MDEPRLADRNGLALPRKTLRDSLERHLAALLDQPLEKVPLDGALIEDARRTFSRVTLAERVYSTIKGSQQARALPPWRPADAAGASGVRVFIRRSGAPLTEGVPGFYTIDGFYKVLLPSLPTATMQVASESWVLGRDAQIDPLSPQVLTLQRDVIALYTADYAKQWDALLGDLDVEPMRNLQQAVQELYILASPQSPMRDLLAGITRQLTLTQPPPPPPGIAGAVQGAAQSAGTAASQAAGSGAATLQGLFEQVNGPPPEPPGKAIEDRYAALIAFVGKGTGRADRQRAEAAERSAGAACATGGSTGGRCGRCRRRRRPGAERCRPRPAAIRNRCGAGWRRWRSAATSCAAAARSTPRRRRSAHRAVRPRCASRRSPAAIRSPLGRPTTSRWMTSPDCSRPADCWTNTSTRTC